MKMKRNFLKNNKMMRMSLKGSHILKGFNIKKSRLPNLQTINSREEIINYSLKYTKSM
jgi:hypothetical protein